MIKIKIQIFSGARGGRALRFFQSKRPHRHTLRFDLILSALAGAPEHASGTLPPREARLGAEEMKARACGDQSRFGDVGDRSRRRGGRPEVTMYEKTNV